jgi:hypothetical protein
MGGGTATRTVTMSGEFAGARTADFEGGNPSFADMGGGDEEM